MVGELTRAFRRRLGITQEELAERTGISARAIRAIETGRSGAPRPATLRLLADAFGLSDGDRERYFTAAAGGDAAAAPGMAVTPVGGTPPPGAAPNPPPGGHPVPTLAGVPVPATRVPEQLPFAVAGFAGRQEQLGQLDGLLEHRPRNIAVISGGAGTGKTTLAVHWGHRVTDRFPDGQLHVNLRGFGPSGAVMNPAEALQGFLHALQVPPHRIPGDLPGQAALYRSVLARRRMLVVADNARDADQIRPLIPGAPDSMLVVTSRRRLTSLVVTESAVPVTLDLLPEEEARQLLIERLGYERVAAEPEAVDELVARCAQLPLALAVVAARAAVHPEFRLATFAEQLRNTDDRLDALHGGDAVTDVRTVFSWSYQQLSPEAAEMFRLLGLHPGPDVGPPAAASLANVGTRKARRILTELADTRLVTEPAPGRYGLHDLMRDYAAELADEVEPTADRHAALHRMLDHYLHTGAAADRATDPHWHRPTLDPPVPGAVYSGFDDRDAATAWLTAELDAVVAATRHAAGTGFGRHVWQLAATLHQFLHRTGRWHEAAALQRAALEAAERLADPVAQAFVHYHLGGVYARMGRLDKAERHIGLAFARYGDGGDQAGRARAQHTIGFICEQRGQVKQALRHARRALELARLAGDVYQQARSLCAIGWHYALLGEPERTRDYCEQSIVLFDQLDDPDKSADAWDSMGFASHHLGRYDEALSDYRQALRLYRLSGNRFMEAATLTHLGQTERDRGRADLARAAWLEALTILTELDHSDADHLRDLLHGLDHPEDHPEPAGS